MKGLDPRDRPGLPLVLLLAAISATVGAVYGSVGRGRIDIGAAIGAINGGSLSFIEIFVLARWGRAALARWSFASYFALRVALYVTVVLAANLVALEMAGVPNPLTGIDLSDIEFAFSICVGVNLLFSVNDLLGPGVLFAFAAGRYRRPRREERALLYIDLCGSTALAERLGETRFLDFLNAFFADVTEPVIAEGGEIHKYVGDEIIAVWRPGTDPARPIRACFAARGRLAARAWVYRDAFGETPAFRAAIHAGPVVIGELGARKKEIALIGDAMNTAARILEAARATGSQVLISAPFFERIGQKLQGVAARPLPPIPLRGKSVPLALIRLEEERAALAGG